MTEANKEKKKYPANITKNTKNIFQNALLYQGLLSGIG